MGRVGPGTVTATFLVFNPTLVAKLLPPAWEATDPREVAAARLRGVDAAYRRLLGDDVATSPDVAEAAELTRTAVAACDPAGRPLYAAHADLAWPAEPHLALWFGLTLLREFRGDGHIAATLSAGLTGLEALVTHTATGTGFTEPAAKATRGWSDEQWARRGRRPRRARPDDPRRRSHRAGQRPARRDRVRHRRARGGALGRAR